MSEMTWADIDKLEADRQAKRIECVDRLVRILSKEFTENELKFVQYYGGAPVGPIVLEAFERARVKARRSTQWVIHQDPKTHQAAGQHQVVAS